MLGIGAVDAVRFAPVSNRFSRPQCPFVPVTKNQIQGLSRLEGDESTVRYKRLPGKIFVMLSDQFGEDPVGFLDGADAADTQFDDPTVLKGLK